MQDLKFDDGLIELSINGDMAKKIKFNPTDVNLYNRLLNFINETEKTLKEIMQDTDLSTAADKMTEEVTDKNLNTAKVVTNKLADYDKQLKEKVDELLGEDSSEKVFGNISCLSMATNGDYILFNFLGAIVPFFEKSAKEREKKAMLKVNEIKKEMKNAKPKPSKRD